jgi:hypothetical protein
MVPPFIVVLQPNPATEQQTAAMIAKRRGLYMSHLLV